MEKKPSSKKVKVAESAKQKLLNKKEGFLQASRIIDKNDILAVINELGVKHSDVLQLDKSLGAKRFYSESIDAVLSPFLAERLSVFAEHYPKVFERHVFCGLLSGLIARNLGMDESSRKQTIVAALARDVGLLYLPEKLLDENSRYSTNDWNAMKTHTLVGEIITRDIGEFDTNETRAVLEHHERHDGMGYPKGLKGKDLSPIGQIVGAVDTVAAIRFKRFEHSGRNLRDVFSYIQMNETTFHPKVNGALYDILVNTGIDKSMVNPFKRVDKLVSHLYVRAAAMNGVIHLMEKLDDALKHFDDGPKRKELQKTNEQVGKLIRQSGVLDEHMLEWLNSMDNNYDYRKVDIAELSEMELLQNELYWHLKRVSDACQAFHDTEMNKRSPSAQVITTILRCISEKNLPRAAQHLK